MRGADRDCGSDPGGGQPRPAALLPVLHLHQPHRALDADLKANGDDGSIKMPYRMGLLTQTNSPC